MKMKIIRVRITRMSMITTKIPNDSFVSSMLKYGILTISEIHIACARKTGSGTVRSTNCPNLSSSVSL